MPEMGERSWWFSRAAFAKILLETPEDAQITITPVKLTASEPDREVPMVHRAKQLVVVDATWFDYSETQDQRDAYRSKHYLILGDQIMEI